MKPTDNDYKLNDTAINSTAKRKFLWLLKELRERDNLPVIVVEVMRSKLKQQLIFCVF